MKFGASLCDNHSPRRPCYHGISTPQWHGFHQQDNVCSLTTKTGTTKTELEELTVSTWKFSKAKSTWAHETCQKKNMTTGHTIVSQTYPYKVYRYNVDKCMLLCAAETHSIGLVKYVVRQVCSAGRELCCSSGDRNCTSTYIQPADK